MFIAMFTAIVCYLFLIVLCSRNFLLDSDVRFEDDINKVEDNLQKKLNQKEKTFQEKMTLESEAMELSTLYEITKDITKSLREEEAFEIFQRKLRNHVHFTQCFFLGPKDHEIKELRKDKDHYIFSLKEKKKLMGYLVVVGIAGADREKVTILGHQFALALRRVKLYEEIERIAITDSLTEIHTRRHTLERFQEELSRSKLKSMQTSFLMIDVDFFKSYNDKYGHITGDKVLREIGEILKESIREIDIAGRYGGEEFCVVLPDTDREGARLAAERIREATEGALIKAYDTEVKVTVSIGIATFPVDGKKVDELIDKADWALYRSKKLGRNRVSSFGIYEE